MDRCYNGEYLTNTGINKGESYPHAFSKINDYISGEDHSWEIGDRCQECDKCSNCEDYVYRGEDLVFIGVIDGDKYEDIFKKIDTLLANM